MKNVLRAFALSLVVTGAVASVHINNSPTLAMMTARTTAMPTPMCPPNDPSACGLIQK
jgi:hypothetical protein